MRGKVLIEYNSLNQITLPISTQCPFRSMRLSCWRSTATCASTEDSTAKGPKALNHTASLEPASGWVRACWSHPEDGLSTGHLLVPARYTLP